MKIQFIVTGWHYENYPGKNNLIDGLIELKNQNDIIDVYWACHKEPPQTIKDNSWMILDKKGGEGCLVELYDKAVASNFITPVEMQKVVDLDKLEQTSSEMSNV